MLKSGKVQILSRSREWGISMLRTRRWFALGLMLAPGFLAPALLAQTQAGETAPPAATPHHRSHKTQKPLVLPPLPSGPLRQLPMDQIPPTPAKVSYQNGLLAISASNSTLGEILRDVHTLTGASIDIPQGSGANERVVTSLGPGSPREVLAGLLNGSSFNYVLLGSNSDPAAVSSVILSARPYSSGDIPPASNTTANAYQNDAAVAPRPFAPQPFNRQLITPQTGPPGNAQAAAADDDDSKDDDDKDDDADDQAKPGQPGQPDANGTQQQQPDPNQPNAGPKTPEQILNMLRQGPQPGNPITPQQPPPQPPQQ
jgi:hypothetical protein